MKKFNIIAAAAVFSGGLIFGGCSEAIAPETPKATAAPSDVLYKDGKFFVNYHVTEVNAKGEVFADAFDGAEGLYLDTNENGFAVGDVIEGSFTYEWDFIGAKLVEKATVTTEDGSKVAASYYE